MENIAKSVEECMGLLRSGKKVIWNRIYTGSPVPTIKVEGENGVSDYFELECVGELKFETYMTEKPVHKLETVSIVSYGNHVYKKIEYVYSNPQMNRTFAHLEDGTDVGYNLSLIDFWSAYGGEYKPEVNKPYEFQLVFFKVRESGHRKYYTEETVQVPREIDEVWKLSDYLRETCDMYKGMDIYVNFPEDFKNAFPLFIAGETRRFKE